MKENLHQGWTTKPKNMLVTINNMYETLKIFCLMVACLSSLTTVIANKFSKYSNIVQMTMPLVRLNNAIHTGILYY